MTNAAAITVGTALLFLGTLTVEARRPASTEEITARAFVSAVAVGDAPAPCRETIGRQPALALVRYCRWVSSATHPPCNTANQCALIVEHIRGMCPATSRDPLPCGNGIT